jgi:hypothetical protein
VRTLDRFQGRRREDRQEGGAFPDDMQPGDYWKVLNEDGTPKIVHHDGKLTEECWRIVVPMGDGIAGGYGIGNLDHHTVRENEDGMVSVLPGDGSSNSILVGGPRDRSWHGYIYSGEFREIG